MLINLIILTGVYRKIDDVIYKPLIDNINNFLYFHPS